ncbi:adenylyltransferase/cytidyltransferase family protein [Candidatus Gottesmanbacteria bacterium]|nr:adenylyltransferase/cytidyltransferase family protein [Candidatus Gottesmanbacteria bacterium]
MTKILSIAQAATSVQRIKNQGKTVILVGGCFDILHVGHVKFLKAAKQKGGHLFVLLESDETVQKIKGKNRPFFTQRERAEMLSELQSIDFVILLPPLGTDEEYHTLISSLRPDIIAVTPNDPHLEKKRLHAHRVGAKIVFIPHINPFSTTRVINHLGIE